MAASFTILFLLFILATTVFWWALRGRPPEAAIAEGGPMKRLVAVAVALVLALGACTGVRDEKGWDKVLKRNYPCRELVDVAKDLPRSVDHVKVAEDLRQRGCEPPPEITGRS